MQLLFTDTDSYCVMIDSVDLDQDLKELETKFDFSNYPENHPNFNRDHKMDSFGNVILCTLVRGLLNIYFEMPFYHCAILRQHSLKFGL